MPADGRLDSAPAVPVTVLSGHADGAVFVWRAEGTHGLQRIRCATAAVVSACTLAKHHCSRLADTMHYYYMLGSRPLQRWHCQACNVALLFVRRQLPPPGPAGAVRGIALCSSSPLLLVAHASGGMAVRSSEVAAPSEDAAAGCPQHVLLLKVCCAISPGIATTTF